MNKLIDLGNGIFLDLSNGETKEDFDLLHKRKRERRNGERRKTDHSISIFNLNGEKERIYLDSENEFQIERRNEERRFRFIPSLEDIKSDLRKYGYSSY